MTSKLLLTDPKKCTGCGLCEIACSIKHTGMSSPARSRIRILTCDAERFVPVTCQQCEEAPCVDACPQEALGHDAELKRVKIDYAKCIACRMCVAACPYGAMGYEADRGRVFKCNQCDGSPECVNWCTPGALIYADTVTDSYQRLRASAQRIVPTRYNQGA
jgi:Fe-S-cluster-containing hydrogenase component 2